MAKVLTAQADDFPRWYQDVLSKAQLAENGPVRGTMVIRPYGYSIWERIQSEVDDRIKAAGAENAYFPLFIPESYLQREADHVEGFSPELAVVTHAGGKELDEPIVVRPTSETVIGEYMGKWVQSYRDLPLLLNSWNNVVRWELRPRLFLRTTEFLWQEGHTAHASREDAAAYATRILQDVYRAFMVDVLAMPVLVGWKTPAERFAGAINTMTCEAMMRDGKALQMGTSHELGQNFAKVFDITYLDADGATQYCWTTSWGSTTRMIGGLIMVHGDDAGIVVPPRLAPIQAVVLLVKDDGGAGERAAALAAEVADAGVRVRLDDKVATSFGRRATDWELKGVPVRSRSAPATWPRGSSPWSAATPATRCRCPWPRPRRAWRRWSSRSSTTCWPPPPPAATPPSPTSARSTRRPRPPRPASPACPGQRSPARARRRSPGRASRCAACSTPTAGFPPTPTRVTSWPSSRAPTDREVVESRPYRAVCHGP
jgi:prolyl-tRNA synthetase